MLKGKNRWCDDQKTLTSDDWIYVNMIRWVVLHIVPNIRLGLCLENAHAAYNPERLVPTVKCGGGSTMIWTAISWCSDGPTITMNG